MQRNIDLKQIEVSKLSVADSTGFVFFWEGGVFRAIRYEACDRIKELFSCGLIDDLVRSKLFPESEITSYKLDGYGMILEHERIKSVTYPYEWTFRMLKDAALTVLKTNLIASKYGFQTLDCHGYNILFEGVQPKFTDIGSFSRVKNGKQGWAAYDEFIRFYYYPLKIWSKGNDYVARKALFEGELMPHYSYLLYKLPIIRNLNIKYVKNISRLLSFFQGRPVNKRYSLKRKMLGYFVDALSVLKIGRTFIYPNILFSFIKKTRKLHKKKFKSEWGQYQEKHFYDDGDVISSPRFDRIIEIIKGYDIKTVVDLASNQGVFSRLILEQTDVQRTVCIDYDENAVDHIYKCAKHDSINGLVPILQNFVFPVATLYTTPVYRRFKSEAVLALAVTHHLLLTQTLPLNLVFEAIKSYTRRYAFIEFMPKGLYNGHSAPPFPTWYTLDWFRQGFEKHFNLIIEEPLENNRILLFGELL